MNMRADPWHNRSTISKWAHVLERSGLALAGGSCGLFVAAEVGRANIDLFASDTSVFAMMVLGTIGFYLGIDLPSARLITRNCRCGPDCAQHRYGGITECDRHVSDRCSGGLGRFCHHPGRDYYSGRGLSHRNYLGSWCRHASCSRHDRTNARGRHISELGKILARRFCFAPGKAFD